LSQPNNTFAQHNPFAPNNPFLQNSAGPMRQPLSFGESEAMRRELRTHPIWVAQNMGQPGYSVTVGGSAQVDGNEAKVLDVLAAGAEVRWFVDARTGHIVRSLKKALDPDGLSQEITDGRYSDWRSFNGLTLPTREVDMHEGGVTSIELLEDFEVNPQVDDSVFRRPSDW
jgi:hypothetical protein